MTARARLAAVCVALAASSGCITSGTLRPEPAAEFPEVLSQSRADAASGRYADADRLLAQFSVRYPGSRQAVETEYWRAVFQLDPANHDGSLTTALMDLDQYLSGSQQLPHYDEASILRRVAAQLQTATRLAATSATTQTTQTTTRTVTSDTQDQEIQKLRDQLAKANEELDRIKKRLAAPTRP